MGILALLADMEGRSEAARIYRRQEHKAFAAFTDNRRHIEQYCGSLIAAIVAGLRGAKQTRDVLQAILTRAEEYGWRIAAVVERIQLGEQNVDRLVEDLDATSALVIRRIMETLAQPTEGMGSDVDSASFTAIQKALERNDRVSLERDLRVLVPQMQEVMVALQLSLETTNGTSIERRKYSVADKNKEFEVPQQGTSEAINRNINQQSEAELVMAEGEEENSQLEKLSQEKSYALVGLEEQRLEEEPTGAEESVAERLLAAFPFTLKQELVHGNAAEFKRVLQSLSFEEQKDLRAWETLGILADLAGLEGQEEVALNYRRREREAFAAFDGNRYYLELKRAPLIFAVANAALGDVQARHQIEADLPKLEENGLHIGPAIARIWTGERDWELLVEDLDRENALLILRVLETLAQSWNSDDSLSEQYIASLSASVRDVLREWIKKAEPLIFAIASASLGDERTRHQIEADLPKLEERGWHIGPAIAGIWAGERNWYLLSEGLDAYTSLIVLRVLEALEQFTDSPENIFASLPPAVRDVFEQINPGSIEQAIASSEEAFSSLSPEEQATAVLGVRALLSNLEPERGDFRFFIEESLSSKSEIQDSDEQGIPLEQVIEAMQMLLGHLPLDLQGLYRPALLRDLADTIKELPTTHPLRKLDQIEEYYREALLSFQAHDRLLDALSIEWSLVEVLNEQGRYSDALELLQTVVIALKTMEGTESTLAEVLPIYADTLENLGRTEEALVCYTEAITMQPESAVLLRNRAASFIHARRLIEAEVDLARAVEIEGNEASPYLWFRRAELAIARGDDLIADQMLDNVISLVPPHEVAFLRALSAWLRGDLHVARERLRSASTEANSKDRAEMCRSLDRFFDEHPHLSGKEEMRELLKVSE